MQSQEITERIKISDKAIRINELWSLRLETKKNIEESYEALRKINVELSRLLPAKIDKGIPSCEKCGGDLAFADVIETENGVDAKMFCKKCEPYE